MNRQERRALQNKRNKALAELRARARAATDPLSHLRFGDELARLGQYRDALQHYEKALEAFPEDKALLNNLAYVLSYLGDRDKALDIYQRARALAPDDPTLLKNMGILYRAVGRHEEAAECLAASVKLDPQNIDTHFNLAMELRRLDREAEADHHFQSCVAIYRTNVLRLSHDPVTMTTVGKGLLRLNNVTDALHVLEGAAKLNPNNAQTLAALAEAKELLQQKEVAFALYQKSLSIDPSNVFARQRVASLYAAMDKNEQAAREYRRILQYTPDNEEARYHLSALTQKNVPAVSPREYIKDLFDDYADRFDEHLLKALQYRGPQLIADTMARLAPADAGKWTVADLGCGTGLCGPLFRDRASHLIGVDLSPRMVHKARQRNVYDDLVVGDVVDFLHGYADTFDCIIAADVLVYIGDLAPIMTAAMAAAKAGGWFAFTTETAPEGEFHLASTGRYTHNPAYIRSQAEKSGFNVAHQEAIVLRYQGNKPVDSTLTVLRKI